VILVIVTPAGIPATGIPLVKSPPPSWNPPLVLLVNDTVVLADPDAVKVTGVPGQTEIEPAVPFAKAVTVGPGLTFTGMLAVPTQPPTVTVYVIIVLPADTPVTVPPTTVAPGPPLDHVPPPGFPVNVVVPPTQVVDVPVIVTVGGTLIVSGTFTVVTHPLALVEVKTKVSACAVAVILVRFPTREVVGAVNVPDAFMPIRFTFPLVQA